MKKVFMSTLVLLVAAMVSAATYSWEKVVTITLTDGNNDTYSSRFGAAPELSDQASWGAVSANLTGATVRAYTTLGGVDYEQLYLNSIENLPLTIKSYNSTTMTFTLTANEGTISLYDNGVLVLTVEKGGVATDNYECTVPLDATITDRFVINYVPAPVYDAELTTNADGWASFAFGSDLEKVESELVIYKGEYNDDSANPEIALTEIADIPANAGVFVKGAANTTYHFNIITTAAADMTDNDIVACVAATPVSTFGTDAIYALRYANGATALYQYVGTADIPAHKAVLPIAGLTPSSAPKRISMRINGTQAVDNVEAIAPAEKFVENGQVLIRRGEAVYNLQGQMVR